MVLWRVNSSVRASSASHRIRGACVISLPISPLFVADVSGVIFFLLESTFLEKFPQWGPFVVHLKISSSCWKISTGLIVLGWQLFSLSPLKLWFHFCSHWSDEGIVCFSHHLSFLAASQRASFIFGVQSFSYSNSRVDFFYPACDAWKFLNLRIHGFHEFKRILHHLFSNVPPLYSLHHLFPQDALNVCYTFIIYICVFTSSSFCTSFSIIL